MVAPQEKPPYDTSTEGAPDASSAEKPESAGTPEAQARQITELEAENARMRSEIAEMRRQVEELRASRGSSVPTAPSSTSRFSGPAVSAVPGTSRTNPERPWVAEDDALAADLERVRAELKRARDTVRPLQEAAAKQELAELLRRRIAELERIQKESTEKGLPVHRYASEGDLQAARAELGALETPPGWMAGFAHRVQEGFTAAKRTGGGWLESVTGALKRGKEKLAEGWERTKKARGFIWERVKGMGTGGIYEALQWEKIRSNTAELFKALEQDTKRLNTEQRLQEQADLIMRQQGYEHMSPQERAELVVSVRTEFLEPMRKANELKIEEMVWAAMEIYKERLKKVKRAMTGESAVSPENLARVESAIRQRLQEQAADVYGRDLSDFLSTMRRLADPDWKWRLGFAGVEAVLAGLGLGWVGGKIIEGGGQFGGAGATSGWEAGPKPVPTGIETVPATVPTGLEGAGKELFIKMHANVWTTLKQLAASRGVDLSNSQLMDVTHRVLVDNGLFEKQWAMDAVGKLSSRALPEGFLLNLAKLSPAHLAMLGLS